MLSFSSPKIQSATAFIVLCLLLLFVMAAQARRVTTERGGGDLPDSVVEYKWPIYPYLARVNLFDGQGFFRLQINSDTGSVSSVTIVKSTTHKILDDAAIRAFRKWRFKPHSAEAVIVPVTFTLEGRHLSEARRLAVYAVEPERPVTFHTGSGAFRFIVDYETGKVVDVQIIKSSGRISFDQAVVKAYRQWCFLPRKVHSIDTTVGFAP